MCCLFFHPFPRAKCVCNRVVWIFCNCPGAGTRWGRQSHEYVDQLSGRLETVCASCLVPCSVWGQCSTFPPPCVLGQVLLSAHWHFISAWLLPGPYRRSPPQDTALPCASLTYIPLLEMNGLVFGCVKHMLMLREG